jgi:hypothetical protein
MEETMKTKTILSMLLVIATSFLLAHEGPRHEKGRKMGFGGRGGIHFFMNEEVLEKIGVGKPVRDEIKKESENMKKQVMEIGLKIKEHSKAMKIELRSDKPDRTLLDSLNVKIAELKKEQSLIIGKFKTDILLKLTTEQRKKALDFWRQRRNNFMKKMMNEEQIGNDKI